MRAARPESAPAAAISDRDAARKLAEEWIAAWNSHDLDRILSHYAEDVEFHSPFIRPTLGEDTDVIRGKAALRTYFAAALATYPELQFRLLQVFTGVDSLTLVYESVKRLLAAEVMFLGGDRRITRAVAHYTGRP